MLQRFAFTAMLIAAFFSYSGWTSPDIVAYWSFDEECKGNVLHDQSGNRHHGSIMGAPEWVDGISGEALFFDGIDDYVVIPDHGAFTNQAALSVAVWVKLRAYGTHSAACFVLKWGAGGSEDDSWHIATHNYSGAGYSDWIYRPDWALSDGGARTDSYTRDPIPLNKWVYLVGTWDGDSARIYMNGELQGVKPWSKPLNNNATALYLGRSEPPAGDFVDGAIDEVKIYNRALSAAEIAANYHALASSLIAYWACDEGEGTVLHDKSGNGHDGVLHGSPQWTKGICGKSLCLDGIDDYAIIPDHDAFTNQSALSVELWTKLQSYGSHPAACFVLKWGAGSSEDDSWHIATHNYGGNGFPDWIHRPDWALSNGVSRADAYTRNPIPLKKWVHLVGTWDGDSARIYMNGELQGVKPWSRPLNNNATALYLGRSEPPAGDFVDGRIDEVKIYNRVLSAAEVHHYSLTISSTDETEISGGIMQPALKKIFVKTTARAIIIHPDRRISGTISLFDITGKRIRTVCVGPNGECAVIPMENQAKGMYVVRIASGGRAVFSTRIIVAE